MYGGGGMREEERGKGREFMIISGLYNGKLKGEGENWFWEKNRQSGNTYEDEQIYKRDARTVGRSLRAIVSLCI